MPVILYICIWKSHKFEKNFTDYDVSIYHTCCSLSVLTVFYFLFWLERHVFIEERFIGYVKWPWYMPIPGFWNRMEILELFHITILWNHKDVEEFLVDPFCGFCLSKEFIFPSSIIIKSNFFHKNYPWN